MAELCCDAGEYAAPKPCPFHDAPPSKVCGCGCDDTFPSTVNPQCPVYGWVDTELCRNCGGPIEPLRDGGWNHDADGFSLCPGNVGVAEPEPHVSDGADRAEADR